MGVRGRVAVAAGAVVVAAIVTADIFLGKRVEPMTGWEKSAAGNPVPESDSDHRVYVSPLAGSWYPGSAQTLQQEIDRYLANVPDLPKRRVCAVIMPHAGYRWSGQTAAYAAKSLLGQSYARVIVMGPTHRLPLRNMASVPSETHYATPLGEIPIDQDCVHRLRQHDIFTNIPQAHHGEHSVQIELPFLQTVLKDFTIVPIVVGQLDLTTTRRMAEVLHKEAVDNDTLVVVSSDFTHYGPGFNYVPFRDNVAQNLKKLDMGAWDAIRAGKLEDFYQYIDETGATICGRYPIGVLLAMLPDTVESHLVHYDTSGNLSGDYDQSVSYVSIVISGMWERPSAESPEEGTGLSSEDKKELLALARRTLEFALQHQRIPSSSEVGYEPNEATSARRGVFVTLRKDGQLRGCIGEIMPRRPMYEAIMAQAINAGLNDTRFLPVTRDELPEITFEISVLTEPQEVPSYENIVLGRDGIILRKDGRSAVFLPKVATEQGWTLEQTLNHLARKAGLAAESWREGASFSVFQAEVFSEGE